MKRGRVPVLNGFYNSLFNYDTRVQVVSKLQRGESLDSLRKEHFLLLTKNPDEINRFLNFCDYHKGNWKCRIEDNINPTLKVARELIAMLRNEYGFSDNE